MKRTHLGFVLASVIVLVLAANTVWGQDFHQYYNLAKNGSIRISNISGNVKVAGYQGNTIEVRAFKVGRDRDLVEVEDQSTSDKVALKVRYPERGNCNASINFEVLVPQSIEYNFESLASVSGNVEIAGVQGRLRAESVSGNVDVQGVSGVVSAGSVSGNVDVQITKVVGSGQMKFTSVSGNVNVTAPADLEADVEMSSISGSLKSDFAIEVQEQRYGPGRSARGRLGGGSNSLRITTVSGRVSLVRR